MILQYTTGAMHEARNVYHLQHSILLFCEKLFSYKFNRGFEPKSNPTKDYEIGICCFSSEHAALRRKSKDWLAWNRDNVPSGAICLPSDISRSELAL
jgi:hypothetical protein